MPLRPDRTYEACLPLDDDQSIKGETVAVPTELLRDIRLGLLLADMYANDTHGRPEDGPALAETLRRDRLRLLRFVPYEA